jgi:hypothetical protein
MERAISVWEKLNLPPLQLNEPWFGYSMGYWSEEEEREADAALAGKYYDTGETFRKSRRKI